MAAVSRECARVAEAITMRDTSARMFSKPARSRQMQVCSLLILCQNFCFECLYDIYMRVACGWHVVLLPVCLVGPLSEWETHCHHKPALNYRLSPRGETNNHTKTKCAQNCGNVSPKVNRQMTDADGRHLLDGQIAMISSPQVGNSAWFCHHLMHNHLHPHFLEICLGKLQPMIGVQLPRNNLIRPGNKMVWLFHKFCQWKCGIKVFLCAWILMLLLHLCFNNAENIFEKIRHGTKRVDYFSAVVLI